MRPLLILLPWLVSVCEMQAAPAEVSLTDLNKSYLGKFLVVQTDLPGHTETYERILPHWAVSWTPQGLIFSGRLDAILPDTLFMTLPVDGSDARRECPVGKKHVLKIWVKDDGAA